MKIPSPLEMQLLSLVALNELSGREAAKRYKSETNKTISYGTLYTTFRRLKEAGWVQVRDDQDEDGRIRFFKLTGGGRAALSEGGKYYADLAGFAHAVRGAT